MFELLKQYAKKGNETEVIEAVIKAGSATAGAKELNKDPGNVRAVVRRLKRRAENDTNSDLPQAVLPRILYYDIETTNFNADFGEILMFAYRWHDSDEVNLVSVVDYPKSFSLPVERRDRFVVKELSQLLNQADIIVAHYGSKFDNKFVQARLAIHGLPYFDNRPSKMFDTCLVARNQMKIGSNRLANLAQAMGLKEEKTSLTKTQWRRANDYDAEALEAMGEYCKQDVRALFEVAQKLRPLAKHLPSWLILEGGNERCCYACGGALQAKGFWHTKANSYVRYQCAKCGAWQRSATAKNKISSSSRVMY